MGTRSRWGFSFLLVTVFVIDHPQCATRSPDHLQLAVAYLEVERYDRALQEVRRARREKGRSTVGDLIAALAHTGLGQPDAAVSTLVKGLRAEPANTRLHGALREICARHENYTVALDQLAPVLESQDPPHPILLTTVGWLHAAAGEYQKALGPLQDAAATSNGDMLATTELSRTLEKLERPQEAVEILDAALQKAPNHPELLLAAGLFHLRRADPETATGFFDSLITVSSDPSQAAARLAGACYEAGSHDFAVRYYERAIELGATEAYVYNNLAWSYAATGRNLDRALSLALRAVKKSPDNPGYLDTYAEVCFGLGQVHRAVALMRRALELEPVDGTQREYLIEQMQRFQQALEAESPPS